MYIGGAVNSSITGLREDVVDDDMEQERVILIVHDIKPPFLDGKTVFTKQTKPVSIVKDANSEMVKCAKKGSAVVKQIRDMNDRNSIRDRFWELNGSKMGKLLKLEEEKALKQ